MQEQYFGSCLQYILLLISGLVKEEKENGWSHFRGSWAEIVSEAVQVGAPWETGPPQLSSWIQLVMPKRRKTAKWSTDFFGGVGMTHDRYKDLFRLTVSNPSPQCIQNYRWGRFISAKLHSLQIWTYKYLYVGKLFSPWKAMGAMGAYPNSFHISVTVFQKLDFSCYFLKHIQNIRLLAVLRKALQLKSWVKFSYIWRFPTSGNSAFVQRAS